MFLGKFRRHLLGIDYVSFFWLTLKGMGRGNKGGRSFGRDKDEEEARVKVGPLMFTRERGKKQIPLFGV